MKNIKKGFFVGLLIGIIYSVFIYRLANYYGDGVPTGIVFRALTFPFLIPDKLVYAAYSQYHYSIFLSFVFNAAILLLEFAFLGAIISWIYKKYRNQFYDSSRNS